MQYGVISAVPVVQLKIGTRQIDKQFVPVCGGYVDLFKGQLEIQISAPGKIDHKKYCKPMGRSDQGFRHD